MLESGYRRVKVRAIFMGTPEFGVPALEYLIYDEYQIVGVYTRPDRLAGRGRRTTHSPIKRAALQYKLPVLQPTSLKRAAVVTELTNLKPDIIVVAAYGQILPKEVLTIPKYGCINIHPSLLPKHRGASPIPSAILAGDEFTGVSIMLMDKELDTGPVITRAPIPISDIDSTGSLTLKLSLIAAYLLQDVMTDWKRGLLIPQPQDNSESTYSSIITKERGEITWHQSAGSIWRQVRAFHPWPGSYTRWKGKRLRIIEAVPIREEDDAIEGRVINLVRGGFGVQTGSGVLEIHRLQMEGKRIMTAEEFLRGQRQLCGSILPS
jgi:methionyl-tRNA formyltransferase